MYIQTHKWNVNLQRNCQKQKEKIYHKTFKRQHRKPNHENMYKKTNKKQL